MEEEGDSIEWLEVNICRRLCSKSACLAGRISPTGLLDQRVCSQPLWTAFSSFMSSSNAPNEPVGYLQFIVSRSLDQDSKKLWISDPQGIIRLGSQNILFV